MMKYKRQISIGISLILSIGALYFAFKHVQITELIHYLQSVQYVWFIPALFISLLNFLLRVVRWQLILNPSIQLTFWECYHPLMIAFMMNCILPGRVGELARPFILNQKHQFSFSAGLSTVAAERFFDLLIMLLLFLFTLLSIDIDPTKTVVFNEYQLNAATLYSVSQRMILICVIIMFGILFFTIDRLRKAIIQIIRMIPHLLSFAGKRTQQILTEKFCIPLIHIIDHIAAGLSIVKSPRQALMCFLLSLIIWVLNVVIYKIIAIGCPNIHLTWYQWSAVMIIVCIFIALPSVPGFWGLWEAGGVFAMGLFGIPEKEAFGFTLTNHFIQIFFTIILGIVSASIIGVNIMKISSGKSDDSGKIP
ncbi:MAG: flippase-like domain-containing protein [Desulfobacterales bacterium]|nr:flippase-like domain-containing protein [Desulfobacterales bacterium]